MKYYTVKTGAYYDVFFGLDDLKNRIPWVTRQASDWDGLNWIEFDVDEIAWEPNRFSPENFFEDGELFHREATGYGAVKIALLRGEWLNHVVLVRKGRRDGVTGDCYLCVKPQDVLFNGMTDAEFAAWDR